MIVPAFLTFTFLRTLIYFYSLSDFNLWFLAIWIASGAAPMAIVQGQVSVSEWSKTLTIAGLAMSMTVNALVTGLIVFRVFKVFQEVKTSTADDQILRVTGGSTLRRVIFIIIESGMALFSIQLARLVMVAAIVNNTMDAATALDAYFFIVSIHAMLNVIIILVIATLFY